MANSDIRSDWLACVKRATEKDVYGAYSDERLANMLAEHVGFPLDGHEKIDVYEFWDLIIAGLKVNGYKIVDLIYDEAECENTKKKRAMIESLKKIMNNNK